MARLSDIMSRIWDSFSFYFLWTMLMIDFATCNQVSIFPGGHFRKLDPFAIYEASVPLTYVLPHSMYTLPEKSSFSLPDSPFPDQHLRKLTAAAGELDRYIDELQLQAAPTVNVSTKSRRTRAIEAIGDALHWCCGTATDTELHTLTGNEEAVNKHLNSLQDVMKSDHLDLVRSMEDVRGFSRNLTRVIGKMHASMEVMQDSLRNESLTSVKELYSILLAHIIRLESHVYYEQFLANNNYAHMQCKNNLLPITLVPQDLLLKDIIQLNKNMSREGYVTAVSTKMITSYYSLPIVSCKFSPERIVITVKIPIKKIEDQWTLYEYVPSPLVWRNYSCTMTKEAMYVAVSGSVVRTITGLQRESCTPRASGLCMVPRQQAGASVSSECAVRMLRKEPVENLRSACPFYCEPARRDVLITQVAADTYVISSPLVNLSVTCSNFSTHLPVHVPGALEVSIPCDCFLSKDSTIFVSKQFPCFSSGASPTVTHILPISWTSLMNISVDPVNFYQRPVFQNITHILDDNWAVSTPSFFIHNHIPETVFQHVELPKTWWDIEDTVSLKYWIIFLWLGGLSLILLYCIFKLYIVNLKLGLEKVPALPPRPPRV